MLQWCAGTVSVLGPYDMSFIRHGDEVAYVQRLYSLFWRFSEKSTKEK